MSQHEYDKVSWENITTAPPITQGQSVMYKIDYSTYYGRVVQTKQHHVVIDREFWVPAS